MWLFKELLRPLKTYLELILFKRKFRKVNRHNEVIPDNIFSLNKVKVGRYCYGHITFLTWGTENEMLKIGDFVSIGPKVVFIGGGNHRMDTLSTYPFNVKFFGKKREAWSKGPIIVEDDVWIGANVIILSGVTIGRGSVIAAGSVITKNVPPYAIVGGNPGKVLKYRFNHEQIKILMNFDFSGIDKFWANKNKDIIEKPFEDIIKYSSFGDYYNEKV